MLKIEKLNVKIGDKKILNNFNIDIKPGEVHAIMGPNGTGKSTLSKVILSDKRYNIVSGSIQFCGEDITNLKTDVIARKGIFLANQLPCEIDGVTTADFLRTAINYNENKISLYEFINKINNTQKDLQMKDDMVHRSINKGFSGGEKKKNEILQMKILEPKFIILDEIDSGLDVDSLKIVSENVNSYLKEHKESSVLMITHYTRLLEYIKPDFVHVMLNGTIMQSGNYDLAIEIEKEGYGKYTLDNKDNSCAGTIVENKKYE